MDIKDVRKYFLSKRGAYECFPFNEDVRVFKVENKMFGLINIHEERDSFNAKYPKDDIITLREYYEDIVPGYHMHKMHWNTIYLNGDVSDMLIKELIDISYNMIVDKLPKRIKDRYKEE